MKKTFIFLAIFALFPTQSFAAFDTNLAYGTRSVRVIELQEFLTDEGVYTGPITGNFFSLTLAGVKAFQAKYGIQPQSGFFGPLSRAKANGLLSEKLQESNEDVDNTGGIIEEDDTEKLRKEIAALKEEIKRNNDRESEKERRDQEEKEKQLEETEKKKKAQEKREEEREQKRIEDEERARAIEEEIDRNAATITNIKSSNNSISVKIESNHEDISFDDITYDFSISPDTAYTTSKTVCGGQKDIDNGSSCYLVVTFSIVSPGEYTARLSNLTIEDNDGRVTEYDKDITRNVTIE